jgi:N-acetylglutamate synthase
MDNRQPLDVVDVAAQAWEQAYATFASIHPDGFYRAGPNGTSEIITGAPIAELNGVFSTAREPDLQEMETFAASPRLKSTAWSVQVRGEHVTSQILKVADDHGLSQRSTLPFMVKILSESDTKVPRIDGLRTRRLAGKESDLYREGLAAGYEAPEEIFAALAAPSALDHPSMESYIAEVGGITVGTSLGILVDDMVGVFSVSVPPQSRRRGYGAAATAAVLHSAYDSGARAAFLHASPMAVSLYESMGFQLVEQWTIFTGQAL